MSSDSIEAMKSALVELNRQIGEQEQRGEAAREFFEAHLSPQLVFRRANGKVVGKAGQEGFLEGLKSNPFEKRDSGDISVSLLEDRALVTLIVTAKRKDDGSVHRYRNLRLFLRTGDRWPLELWYNHEIANA